MCDTLCRRPRYIHNRGSNSEHCSRSGGQARACEHNNSFCSDLSHPGRNPYDFGCENPVRRGLCGTADAYSVQPLRRRFVPFGRICSYKTLRKEIHYGNQYCRCDFAQYRANLFCRVCRQEPFSFRVSADTYYFRGNNGFVLRSVRYVRRQKMRRKIRRIFKRIETVTRGRPEYTKQRHITTRCDKHLTGG